MKNLMKAGVVAGTTLLAVAALAKPEMLGVFNQTYKVPAGSALSNAHCKTCHVGMTDLNPYGKDIKKALGSETTLTPAVLKKVENLDSDKDGVKNGVEIKAGTLPGDAKSKPAKTIKPTVKKPVKAVKHAGKKPVKKSITKKPVRK